MTRQQALTAINSLSTADLKTVANAALLVTIDANAAGASGGQNTLPATGNLQALCSTMRTLVGAGADITG